MDKNLTRLIQSPLLKIVFFILLVLLVHNRWVVPRISVDQMRQLVALENIMQGHGVTFQLVGDNTESIFLDNSFPMGYYALLAPFYYVFNDTLLLHRVFEIIGLLILIWQLYLFGGWLERTARFKGLRYLLLIFTLIQLNPWRASSFTDIWSLMFFISAFRLVITRTEFSKRILIAIGFLSFCTVFMRYAYYPLAFIPVLLMFIKAPRINLKTLMPALVLVLCIVGMKGFDHWYFAGYDHLDTVLASERFFLSHLRQMEPIGFNAFFSDHIVFGALNIDRWGVNTNWSLKYVVLSCSGVILLFLLIKSLQRFRSDQNKLLQNFEAAAWFSIVITLGFITSMSMYFPSHNADYLYTWSLISRYFAPGYIFLQVLLIYSVLAESRRTHRIILNGFVILSFVFQTAYLGSFLSRFSWSNSWKNYVQFYDRTEMPEVIANYYEPSQSFVIPEEQWDYPYLSMYYISKFEGYKEFIETECKHCQDFYNGSTRLVDSGND